ncbi:hypothetical protein GGR57DRAFT_140196 [Xylariaceae sp. FL1272]|nr:hypothetical protein GGR57DRAFT_140196 [Xylariaceae sp. FL1272]
MSFPKQRISSPLEAGTSLFDNLPPRITEALEYASKRLARKSLHITLIVVRNDYQIPSIAPCTTPSMISPPQTPELTGFATPFRFTSSVAGLRHIVRRGTGSSLASTTTTVSDSTPGTPSFAPPPTEPAKSPRRWMMPLTPGSPMMPLTPHTPSSSATIATSTSATSSSARSQGPESFGIRLVYTSPLSPKDDKTLRTAMIKAERRFHLGAAAFPTVTTASACGFNAELVRRSTIQNEVLFSSEGLTLLGLDRLYTFKAALTAYARSIIKTPSISTPMGSPGLSNHPLHIQTPAPTRTSSNSSRLLEDTVDSLRRLILSNGGGRPMYKTDLYRSFDWMSIHPKALADVEQMYKNAYGGPDRLGPFILPCVVASAEEKECETDSRRMGFVKIGTPPPRRTQTPPKSQTAPVLKLNTKFATTPRIVRPQPKAVPQTVESEPRSDVESVVHGSTDTKMQTSDDEVLEIKLDGLDIRDGEEEEEEEEGDGTAHPLRDGPLRPSLFWPGGPALGVSIDELLSPVDPRQSHQLGPMTPNGYDDISPITRGEWGHLFQGETWTTGRTVGVETC